VQDVLVPTVQRANAELEPEGVVVRLDLNLDPRSTNHAHADLWLSELCDGDRKVGPKYSFNVRRREVWLYKAGEPGRSLGDMSQYGPQGIEGLLRDAAGEFGSLQMQRS
jgi:hypothetical protein